MNPPILQSGKKPEAQIPRFRSGETKPIFRTVFFVIACLLLAGPPAKAQSRERLPDSLNTSVELLPSDEKEPGTVSPVSGREVTEEAAADSGEKKQEGEPLGEEETEPDVLRKIPDSAMARYRKDKDFAYANDPSYWVKEKVPENNNRFNKFLEKVLTSRGFRYFIYFFLGSVLLFAVFKIIRENNLQSFLRKYPRSLPDDPDGAELTEEDLEENLQRAIKAGDHRMGVRYLFLKTLRVLDSRGLIRFHAQTTNYEYLRQMNGNSRESVFRFLTESYEKVWYGGFLLNGDQFERLNLYFQDFFKSVTTAP